MAHGHCIFPLARATEWPFFQNQGELTVEADTRRVCRVCADWAGARQRHGGDWCVFAGPFSPLPPAFFFFFMARCTDLSVARHFAMTTLQSPLLAFFHTGMSA